MQVSVIIIHYNTPELTQNCLNSFIQQTAGLSYEIIVVDNASTIGDTKNLKEQFPQIKLVRSEKNLGFAGGNNLGIKEARGRYILLLNSDTVFKENALLKAYQYLEQHPKAGVVTVRLVYPDGKLQSAAQRFPSIKYTLAELFRLQKFIGHKKAGRLLLGAFFNQEENLKADWVWGAFFLFRKEVLDHLPGNQLDQSFFMYCEDMQWCLDIQKAGYEVHFYSGAEVVHLMGGSNASKQEMMEKNNEVFLKKNYSAGYIKTLKFLQQALKRSNRS
jgi:GT2 family glycosyltransferase